MLTHCLPLAAANCIPCFRSFKITSNSSGFNSFSPSTRRVPSISDTTNLIIIFSVLVLLRNFPNSPCCQYPFHSNSLPQSIGFCKSILSNSHDFLFSPSFLHLESALSLQDCPPVSQLRQNFLPKAFSKICAFSPKTCWEIPL